MASGRHAGRSEVGGPALCRNSLGHRLSWLGGRRHFAHGGGLALVLMRADRAAMAVLVPRMMVAFAVMMMPLDVVMRKTERKWIVIPVGIGLVIQGGVTHRDISRANRVIVGGKRAPRHHQRGDKSAGLPGDVQVGSVHWRLAMDGNTVMMARF
ncbi:MAG: hypothetical protein ACE5EM_11430 [Sphingomonadales bacterium]